MSGYQELTGLLSDPDRLRKNELSTKTLAHTLFFAADCGNGHSPLAPIQAAEKATGRQHRYCLFCLLRMT